MATTPRRRREDLKDDQGTNGTFHTCPRRHAPAAAAPSTVAVTLSREEALDIFHAAGLPVPHFARRLSPAAPAETSSPTRTKQSLLVSSSSSSSLPSSSLSSNTNHLPFTPSRSRAGSLRETLISPSPLTNSKKHLKLFLSASDLAAKQNTREEDDDDDPGSSTAVAAAAAATDDDDDDDLLEEEEEDFSIAEWVLDKVSLRSRRTAATVASTTVDSSSAPSSSAAPAESLQQSSVQSKKTISNSLVHTPKTLSLSSRRHRRFSGGKYPYKSPKPTLAVPATPSTAQLSPSENSMTDFLHHSCSKKNPMSSSSSSSVIHLSLSSMYSSCSSEMDHPSVNRGPMQKRMLVSKLPQPPLAGGTPGSSAASGLDYSAELSSSSSSVTRFRVVRKPPHHHNQTPSSPRDDPTERTVSSHRNTSIRRGRTTSQEASPAPANKVTTTESLDKPTASSSSPSTTKASVLRPMRSPSDENTRTAHPQQPFLFRRPAPQSISAADAAAEALTSLAQTAARQRSSADAMVVTTAAAVAALDVRRSPADRAGSSSARVMEQAMRELHTAAVTAKRSALAAHTAASVLVGDIGAQGRRSLPPGHGPQFGLPTIGEPSRVPIRRLNPSLDCQGLSSGKSERTETEPSTKKGFSMRKSRHRSSSEPRTIGNRHHESWPGRGPSSRKAPLERIDSASSRSHRSSVDSNFACQESTVIKHQPESEICAGETDRVVNLEENAGLTGSETDIQKSQKPGECSSQCNNQCRLPREKNLDGTLSQPLEKDKKVIMEAGTQSATSDDIESISGDRLRSHSAPPRESSTYLSLLEQKAKKWAARRKSKADETQQKTNESFNQSINSFGSTTETGDGGKSEEDSQATPKFRHRRPRSVPWSDGISSTRKDGSGRKRRSPSTGRDNREKSTVIFSLPQGLIILEPNVSNQNDDFIMQREPSEKSLNLADLPLDSHSDLPIDETQNRKCVKVPAATVEKQRCKSEPPNIDSDTGHRRRLSKLSLLEEKAKKWATGGIANDSSKTQREDGEKNHLDFNQSFSSIFSSDGKKNQQDSSHSLHQSASSIFSAFSRGSKLRQVLSISSHRGSRSVPPSDERNASRRSVHLRCDTPGSQEQISELCQELAVDSKESETASHSKHPAAEPERRRAHSEPPAVESTPRQSLLSAFEEKARQWSTRHRTNGAPKEEFCLSGHTSSTGGCKIPSPERINDSHDECRRHPHSHTGEELGSREQLPSKQAKSSNSLADADDQENRHDMEGSDIKSGGSSSHRGRSKSRRKIKSSRASIDGKTRKSSGDRQHRPKDQRQAAGKSSKTLHSSAPLLQIDKDLQDRQRSMSSKERRLRSGTNTNATGDDNGQARHQHLNKSLSSRKTTSPGTDEAERSKSRRDSRRSSSRPESEDAVRRSKSRRHSQHSSSRADGDEPRRSQSRGENRRSSRADGEEARRSQSRGESRRSSRIDGDDARRSQSREKSRRSSRIHGDEARRSQSRGESRHSSRIHGDDARQSQSRGHSRHCSRTDGKEARRSPSRRDDSRRGSSRVHDNEARRSRSRGESRRSSSRLDGDEEARRRRRRRSKSRRDQLHIDKDGKIDTRRTASRGEPEKQQQQHDSKHTRNRSKSSRPDSERSDHSQKERNASRPSTLRREDHHKLYAVSTLSASPCGGRERNSFHGRTSEPHSSYHHHHHHRKRSELERKHHQQHHHHHTSSVSPGRLDPPRDHPDLRRPARSLAHERIPWLLDWPIGACAPSSSSPPPPPPPPPSLSPPLLSNAVVHTTTTTTTAL